MTFFICLLVFLYILWLFLIKGFLWKLLLAIGGWFGIFAILSIYVPPSTNTLLTIGSTNFSWAEVIPTIIILLAMATTKSDD
jgi:energy-coupling factor transporter transmembrane protein EcfT